MVKNRENNVWNQLNEEEDGRTDVYEEQHRNDGELLDGIVPKPEIGSPYYKAWIKFNRSNGPRIARLQRKIAGYMQRNQSVLSYFNNLTALWNELDMILLPISCICDAREAATEREEHQKLMQFLNGLNNCYENARNQVLFLDPLPNVDKAYSMILQVEDQKLNCEIFGESGGQMAMNVGYQTTAPHNGNGKQYQFKGQLCGIIITWWKIR